MADAYDAVRRTGRARRRWDRELSLVGRIAATLPPGTRILDVPCGTGRFLPVLAASGCSIVGGDISVDMMRHAPGDWMRAGSRLVSCDVEHLPFGDRFCDYTLCMRFFNLVPPDVAEAVLRELARVSGLGAYVQIRFRRREPLATLARLAGVCASRVRRRRAGPAPGSFDKRWPLLTFAVFERMARRAGLRVAGVYRAGPLLERDPLTVCLLTHTAPSPRSGART